MVAIMFYVKEMIKWMRHKSIYSIKKILSIIHKIISLDEKIISIAITMVGVYY
jgi:hypothetical protein